MCLVFLSSCTSGRSESRKFSIRRAPIAGQARRSYATRSPTTAVTRRSRHRGLKDRRTWLRRLEKPTRREFVPIYLPRKRAPRSAHSTLVPRAQLLDRAEE